jgi:hypothetical protein
MSEPLSLGRLEADVMLALWKQGETTVRNVLEALNTSTQRKRAYTTVMTTMHRLARNAWSYVSGVVEPICRLPHSLRRSTAPPGRPQRQTQWSSATAMWPWLRSPGRSTR